MIHLIVKTLGITNMVKDLSNVLPPDHPMYTDAVEAMKRYHQAQADGVSGAELERLRLLAEHRFQAVTDYQLHAFGGPSETSH
ncbi:hypothetical protein PPS11_01654 [Pseudomonas putida S11]|nr:hypothetical protein PPS11_01654 [Pseudomonas putida S11]